MDESHPRREEKQSVGEQKGNSNHSSSRTAQEAGLQVNYDKLWALQYEFAKVHMLKEGSRIRRTEDDAIYRFEVFRSRWHQERQRVPYRVDWKAQQVSTVFFTCEDTDTGIYKRSSEKLK